VPAISWHNITYPSKGKGIKIHECTPDREQLATLKVVLFIPPQPTEQNFLLPSNWLTCEFITTL